MKIVSWNCNGAFRNKYKELFNAYPNTDVFIVQECEDPTFYNDSAYKAIYGNGFYVGTSNYYTKGIGVFSPKGLWLRRMRCNYANALMMIGYAPFEVENKTKILAVWPHGKYVEEMIDFLNQNENLLTKDILIVGDTNSSSVFNNQHPKGKNHDALIEVLKKKGFVDAYNYTTGEREGEETMPTFYMHRYLTQPFHLDRAFVAPKRIRHFAVSADRDSWLKLSDHISIEIEIDDIKEQTVLNNNKTTNKR